MIIRHSRTLTLAWDDHDLQGAQKFHASAVRRVGGLDIALGLAALAAWVALTHIGPAASLALVLLCGAPALAAGLLEDLTEQFGTKTRLLATAADGALAFLLGFFV
jgi:UDP-N-acetylmuramyl pentapeptide phosphotransferase/UDP-N-acetylglucosamine-1-phosphate transferase